MTAGFKDHFSRQADAYARYRPSYPSELFEFLADSVPGRETAWDCGTGNGQAALSLAGFFKNVIATDASQGQIDHAMAHPCVSYKTATAENLGLADNSIDLVAVGQAFHWFDAQKFLHEARRVLRPQGVLGIWCYETCSVNEQCDEIIEKLYTDIVGDFWPPERPMIEQGYENVVLPGVALDVPDLEMVQNWRVTEQLGYLRTWSACDRYQAAHGADPVTEIAPELEKAWGPERRRVVWPLRLKACRPDSLLE